MKDSYLCYICYDHEKEDDLFATEPSPCTCKGSLVIHQKCLNNIIKTSRVCSICKTRYNINYLPQKDGKELVMEITNLGHRVEYTVNEHGEKHGTYTVKNMDGQTILLHSYINGLMDGPFVEYYDNGQIKSICKCKNNKIDGEYCEWYRNGIIKEESIYKNGKKHGACVEWTMKGGVIIGITTQYFQGEPQGEESSDLE
jgi:antitoxin component YwqK of YwqJK toxin-antitoxin module